MIFRLQRELDSVKSELESVRSGHTPEIRKPVEAASRLLAPISIPREPSGLDAIEIPVSDVSTAPAPTLEETEKESIRKALERNDGRRKATAEELGISERTLYRKIKEYGLE